MFAHLVLKSGAPTWQWILWTIGAFLVLGGAFFAVLQLIPGRYRKTLIAVVTFLAGFIYSIEYFMPGDANGRNFMTGFTEQVSSITNLLYTFAIGLGIYSLMRFHGKNLIRKRSGWIHNLAFFVAFFAMAAAGFWNYMKPSVISTNTYDLIYQSSVAALGATMFSTIGFYIVSAAYRAFRIRSGEATLMLIAAFVVMLGQVPVGAFMTHNLPENGFLSVFKLETISYWIMTVPNMAAQRGISFGIEVGALAMALRTWLSLERGSYFDQEL